MSDAAEIDTKDTVLEIGPGRGILTGVLLSRAHKVIAVEKDKELVALLEEKFAKEIESGKFSLIHGDIREYQLKGNYKVVANIPYYITGEIIRYFLSTENQPKSITLMIQKEVADRIIAKDNKESLLSLSVKAYGEPHFITKVAAGNFFPKPNVDSAILHIENISKKFFDGISEEKFFEVLHAGFAHKRKVLIQNLTSLGTKRERLEKIFFESKIPPKVRAEDLSLAEWQKLYRNWVA